MNRPGNKEEMRNMLSAYLDGELTQADQQRVQLYLESSEEGRRTLKELATLKNLTAELQFGDPPDRRMDEIERRLSVQAPRRFGWALIILGLAAWIVYGLATAMRHVRWPTAGELFAGGVVVGLVLLFLSVLRQRLIERPFDKYRKVKR